MFSSSQSDVVATTWVNALRAARAASGTALGLLAAALLSIFIPTPSAAAEPVKTDSAMTARVQTLIPDLEAYIESGMTAFGTTGLAVGIVTGDRLVYARGFGVRSKSGGVPVDASTLFQIGSATKAFLAATMGIMVDRGKFRWDDRVVDLYPAFQLKDPWVTREFRVFDLIAQRSGLPPYANDGLGLFGIDEAALIRSLRYVDPVSSFRTTFAYTNITHMLAGRIVAQAANAPDWNAALRRELLDPLAMKETSTTAEAIVAAPNHAEGYRWTPTGMIEVPFTQIFPYDFGPAGNINSNVEDMARWVRLQLSNGMFEGKRIVSPQSLVAIRTTKVGINDKSSYAQGWMIQSTPNGTIVWHNGGTSGFGAYVGLQLDRDVGIIVLANAVGFPDGIGAWAMDRILDNPKVDHAAGVLKAVTTNFETSAKLFSRPAHPRPFPPLAPLVGNFVNPGVGKAPVAVDGDALVMEIAASGAKLKLEPWDGDVFAAKLMPSGRFAAMVEDLGPQPNGFVQFQIDKDAKLNLLRFSLDDGQAYVFVRE
jgi:CubicO group peptidase (beta-lactamase class C family)